jgi:hypothetical protein
MDGDFVVFLIGMRINRLWKIHKWLPVVSAMPKMIRELLANKDSGFLSAEMFFGRRTLMVQYWRSYEQLESYAFDQNQHHFPAWKAFNKNIRSDGDVGIWHETYLASKGTYENIYNNMPPFGLGKAGELIPASGKLEYGRDRIRIINEERG